jgi:hypothetical protein
MSLAINPYSLCTISAMSMLAGNYPFRETISLKKQKAYLYLFLVVTAKKDGLEN